MAFGRQKLEKQDLVDAGLDPDKLKEFQEKGVTKDDLTTMSTTLETKLTTTITDQIRAGFTELETKFRPANKEPEKKGNEEVIDEPTEFMTDPTGFINKKLGAVHTAGVINSKRLERDLAWERGMNSLKGMKNETLRTEIETEWKKYPADKMAQYGTDPTMCLNDIHNMVMGRHHDEITNDSNKREGKFNLVHSGSGSGTGAVGSSSNSSSSGIQELTEAEKKIAKKFGMTDDEWRKQGVDMEKEEEDRRGAIAGGR